jgi:CRP-like cAMP-binding protein
MPHLEAMIRKLRQNTNLSQDDVDAIRGLPMHHKNLPANSLIVAEGDRPGQCCLIIKGFCARSKTSDEGRRQILSIHITGDIPDLQSLHLHVMDHDVRTLSACTLGFIPHDALRALTRARPVVAEALWRETLMDAAIFREWIVNVGRRSAAQRLAHFVLEVREKMAAAGLCTDHSFELPMTQLDLADALGLTPVHVNRVLQSLRSSGMLDIKRSEVRLGDPVKLKSLGGFDGMYLHPTPEMTQGLM